MSQDDWPAELARVIGAEVAWLRRQRGLSAQQLSDRCAALGMPFARAVLANLETGRRPTVAVAELLVLAAALDVPPVVLVAPVGRQVTTRILPGLEVSTEDAIDWISGEVGLDADRRELVLLDWLDPRGVRLLYDKHRDLVHELTDPDGLLADAEWNAWRSADSGRVVLTGRDLRKRAETDLRAVRRRMAELDLIPPELPAELAGLADE